MAKPKPVRRIEGDVFNIFVVHEERDKTEGRGGSFVVGHFHARADAEEAAQNKGVFGNDGRIEETQLLSMDGGKTGYAFRLDSDVVQCVMPGHKELKARAMAKLSIEEQEALGLR